MLTPVEQEVLDHYVALRRHGLRHGAARKLAALGTGYHLPHGLEVVDRTLNDSQAWLEREGLWDNATAV